MEKKKMSPWKRVLYLFLAFVLVLIVTNPAILWFLPDNAKAKLSTVWNGLFGNVEAVARVVSINWVSLFQIIAIVLLVVLLTSLARILLAKVKPQSGKMKSIVSMANSFLTYAAVLAGLIWCLSAIGINLSTIFASIGIVALIVGFAAESLIADIITGIFLVFEDEFNVGDVIEYNGFRGTVVSIGVRITSIQDNGGNIKLVNNSDLRNVLNRSKVSSRAVCDIPVSYAADLNQVETILKEILQAVPAAYPEYFSAPPEYFGVQELSASSVNLRVCAQVHEKDIYDAIRIINREVKLGFDRAGVEIPFQQVVIHRAEK